MIAKTLYPILKIALNTLKNCLAVLTSLRILSSVTCARANNFARTRVMSSFRERGVLLYGEAPPVGVPLTGSRYIKAYGFQIHERVGKSVIWVFQKAFHRNIAKKNITPWVISCVLLVPYHRSLIVLQVYRKERSVLKEVP